MPDCNFDEAVDKDDVAAVKKLLRRGCNPNPGEPDENRPVYRAAMNSQKEMTRVLLKGGADPNVADLLQRLSEDSDVSFMRLLLDHGGKVNAQDQDGRSPLHAAVSASHGNQAPGCEQPRGYSEEARCWSGYPQMVRFLLSRGANPNLRDRFGGAPIHTAIASNRSDVAWPLLRARGVDLTITDRNGWTPLHLAARQGALSVMEFLISQRIDPNSADDNGATPLHMTSSVAAASLLLSSGAKAGKQDDRGETPLHRAASDGGPCEASATLAQVLVKRGAPIELKDRLGRTALHHGAAAGNSELVRTLLQRGANSGAKDAHGLTPLHLLGLRARPCSPMQASWRQTVTLLLDAGAGLDDIDDAGRTPLWFALAAGSSSVVDLLLTAGARATARGPLGASPLHLAAYLDNQRFIEQLLRFDAPLDARDVDGKTPLIWAAAHGSTKAASVLLSRGAEPNAKDSQGRTALVWAMTACQQPVVVVLRSVSVPPTLNPFPPCPIPAPHPVDDQLERAARAFQDSELKLAVKNGVAVGGRDQRGRTPLHHVARHFYLRDELRLLLERKADPNAQDDEGTTPLHVAASDARDETARALIDSGAEVNALDGKGRTALHLVPFRNSVYALTSLFVERGANLKATDRLGRSALHAACDGQQEDRPRAEFLVCHGADPNLRDLLGWTPSDVAAIQSWPNARPIACGRAWEDFHAPHREEPKRPR